MIIPYRFLQPPWVSACNCLRFISAMALATPVKKRKVTTEPASSEKVPWHALMRTVSLFRRRFPWCFGILAASYLLFLSLWTPLEALDPGRRQADRDPWLGRWDWALVWWWWWWWLCGWRRMFVCVCVAVYGCCRGVVWCVVVWLCVTVLFCCVVLWCGVVGVVGVFSVCVWRWGFWGCVYMLVCLCVVRVLCVCCVCVLCVLCVRLSFVLFPFSLWFFPLRLLPPGGASSWTLTARRSRCLFGRLGWAALWFGGWVVGGWLVAGCYCLVVGGWLLLFGGWWLAVRGWVLVCVGVCWCVCVLVCVGVCVVCVCCVRLSLFCFPFLVVFPCFYLFVRCPLEVLHPGLWQQGDRDGHLKRMKLAAMMSMTSTLWRGAQIGCCACFCPKNRAQLRHLAAFYLQNTLMPKVAKANPLFAEFTQTVVNGKLLHTKRSREMWIKATESNRSQRFAKVPKRGKAWALRRERAALKKA